MSDRSKPIIKIDNIYKDFKVRNETMEVIRGITFDVDKTDFIIIWGPSGCGKSTLLHIMMGLELPTKGTVHILGKNLFQNIEKDDIAEFRKNHIGTVYQQSNWIKSLNVAENVAFPLLLQGMDDDQAYQIALESLDQIGMRDWGKYAPLELSAGQQQRVALSRALIHDPQIIVADEPTGNLDYDSGLTIMKILKKINTKDSKTVVMVTHDVNYLLFANKIIQVFDGKITATYKDKALEKLVASLKEIQNK